MRLPCLRRTVSRLLAGVILMTSTGSVTAAPNLNAVLPAARHIAWSAGVSGSIGTVAMAANVRDFGAVGDGMTDDTAAIRNAMAAVTNGGAVYFPAGTYLITSKLQITKRMVLRGDGWQATSLLFDVADTPIEVVTYQRGAWNNLTGGYTRGSRTLTLRTPLAGTFRAGQYVEIQQSNHAPTMYTKAAWNVPWAQNAVGQITKISAVKGNVLTLAEPLRHTYSASLRPMIRTQGLIERVGIEQLHIRRLSNHSSATILFKNAANGWLRQVHSEFAGRAHVETDTVYRLTIRDNYFDNAFSFDSGGNGYGVTLGLHSTNVLVENNIFRRLRHAMLLSLGANGNAINYNYSRENLQTQSAGWTPPDLALHGHYAYDNLFDSNIVQQIEIADYWGPAGPRNTFCRNRVESTNGDGTGATRRAIYIQDKSHGQNILGSDLAKGAIVIAAGVSSTYLNGNRTGFNGVTRWVTTTKKMPPSCYYSTRPAFYGTAAWPSVGNDRPNGTIPALQRWRSGSYIP